MPLKKNTPGCPCCTPTGCDVTFVITACCGPAVGASVTVKDGGGTTKGTGTTNSSGSVTINLAGTSGQTLYVFVSYDATHYLPYTNTLLGAHCGRTYSYTLTPITETYGTACGTITLTTTQCDGTTILGGKVWTLQKSSAGGWNTYSTGTTDATTGKSVVTGLTYGGAFDGYRFLVTDATGSVTGTSILLTSTNCVATCLMRMATSSRFPCTTPQDTIAYSGAGGAITATRGCCSACNATSIPGVLNVLSVPNPAAYRFASSGGWSYTGSCSSVQVSKGSGPYSPCQIIQWTPNPFQPCPWSIPYNATLGSGVYGWVSLTLSCEPGGWYLTLYYQGITTTCNGKSVYLGNAFFSGSQKVLASSVTCSPFAATFNMPAFGGSNLTFYGGPSCSEFPSNLFSAATITVTE